jgi:hypothetical protein
MAGVVDVAALDGCTEELGAEAVAFPTAVAGALGVGVARLFSDTGVGPVGLSFDRLGSGVGCAFSATRFGAEIG